jgi:Glycosyl hydrolases family 18
MRASGRLLVLCVATLVVVAHGALASSVKPPKLRSAPRISGNAVAGAVLHATKGSWSGRPTRFTFAWRICDRSGAHCVAVRGATKATYSTAKRDIGHTVRARVTARNGGGAASATSAPTGVVRAAPAPPASAAGGQTVMSFDLGWSPTRNMPWGALTQAILFSLQTQNGSGLSTANVGAVNVSKWVAAAHSHNVQAIISIGGVDDQNWQNACNSTNRAQFVSNLVDYAVSHGFDGIDLDIEDDLWSGQKPPVAAMTTCIEAAASAAHAATSRSGKALLVTEDITTNWMGPWAAPSQSSIDQFNLMTYGDNLATLASDVLETHRQGLPYAKMTVGVDVDDNAEPSGGCTPYAAWARAHGLMGSFVWDATSDTSKGANACTNGLAAG